MNPVQARTGAEEHTTDPGVSSGPDAHAYHLPSGMMR